MSATRKGHTPHIFERRRSLFPQDVIDSEEDSDLGHISPLSFDSEHDDLKYLVSKQECDDGNLLSKTDSIGDYDIIGVVENMNNTIYTPVPDNTYARSETMSPLYLSPYCNKLFPISEVDIINETPAKTSPSYNLKTPHDSCNTNQKVPKLSRKSLLDTLENTSTKRKLSPVTSPVQIKKNIKLDSKNSKVRTTLFPEVNVSLSTKRFYPKTENIMENLRKNKEKTLRAPVLNSVNRKVRYRRRNGQINAGVSHKIKKPKQKKLSKAALLKVATSAANNSAIMDYIKDLKELKTVRNEQTNLIENKENVVGNMVNEKQIITHNVIKENNCGTSGGALEIEAGKKRPLSPLPEKDPNKKFFKFSQARGVVTMNKNIKLRVDGGKITLMEKEGKKRPVPRIEFDSSDLTVEPILPMPNIDNILSSLSDDNNGLNMEQNDTEIVLQAHSSVTASENSILLHPQPVQCAANIILSPISQMCDVTSGLALNSPKKVRNLTSILNSMPNTTSHDTSIFNGCSANTEQQKLFPVFCQNSKNANFPDKRENRTLPRTAKKFKILEKSQMLLDAGQKKFGVTQCTECNFVYHIGDPSDESMHLKYHEAGHVLRFAGWKNERVVEDFNGSGRIIHILPDDSKIWWKKAKELMHLINCELGCYEMEFSLDHCQVFLYIKSKHIAGCIVALPKSQGHRMLTTKEGEADLCSETIYPIKCGVARIWVSRNYQRHGIGTVLMNALKKNFLPGCILGDADIALSCPTDMGKSFAKSYFKSSNYLIYYC